MKNLSNFGITGHEAQLVCIVHGEANPEVNNWKLLWAHIFPSSSCSQFTVHTNLNTTFPRRIIYQYSTNIVPCFMRYEWRRKLFQYSAKANEFPISFCSQLMWYQDSFLLDPTDRRSMDSRGDRHMLTIRNIETSDFGNYRYGFCLNSVKALCCNATRDQSNTKSRECLFMNVSIINKWLVKDSKHFHTAL